MEHVPPQPSSSLHAAPAQSGSHTQLPRTQEWLGGQEPESGS